MNTEILHTEIQDFINDNLNSDVSKILLKGTNFNSVSTQEIIEQIESKLKCKKKLPTWFNSKNIYYPNKLNIEQTSSEIAAKYKSKLLTGNTIIDLTGGFGVDSYYFSKSFDRVKHCELNTNLSAIVTHNNTQLNVKNIETIPGDGIAHLTSKKAHYDWIYIDPSRRNERKKVFFLEDCVPNVPKHLDAMFEHSNSMAIKVSPLLDITVGINELKFVKDIHIVAINNDVKELIWILKNGYDGEVTIKTVNILEDYNDEFSFVFEKESEAKVKYAAPQTYLYEPNSAILKSGGFNSLAERLKLSKLHKHSHLYTSQNLIPFPGRSFRIESILPYTKKNLKQLGLTQANITTRNFAETVQQLRKKFRIKDGGNTYVFFTTNYLNEKIVIICSKA